MGESVTGIANIDAETTLIVVTFDSGEDTLTNTQREALANGIKSLAIAAGCTATISSVPKP